MGVATGLTVFVAVSLLSVFATAAPQCAKYSPKTCVLSDTIEIESKLCHPQECDFDVEKVIINPCSAPLCS